jgi:L-threonylcarbamoyladenylate synthase
VNATGGVGVRISSQMIATELVRTLGRPLTATSANPSGKAPARTMREAKSYFADAIEIFIDDGELPSKTGSSVIEFHGEKIKIIRDGDIKQAELQEIVGEDAILR